MRTQLRDITFKSKQGEVSLASLSLHVEAQGLNTLFSLPTYAHINSVDWQEYDGEDVDFSSASVNAIQMQIKIFGDSSTIDALIADMRAKTTDDDIIIGLHMQEGDKANEITFSARFTGATRGKAVIENEHHLDYFLLEGDDNMILTDEIDQMLMAGKLVKGWRRLDFVTLTFSRHSDILGDNTIGCDVPDERFTTDIYPKSNMPIEFRRYHVDNRQATQVSVFNLFNDIVFCYPLKGVVHGMTGIEPSKEPFTIHTEGMVGEVMETKNADKRRSKTISIPILIRSHSVSAIFQFLGAYKRYAHDTLTGGDMLYLHSDLGDYAVYPSGCNVTRAYLNDQPWVEMTLQFCAYKEGFTFKATTDDVVEDNPEPPLPPAPEPTFNPYKDIDKTQWVGMGGTQGSTYYGTLKRNELLLLLLPSSRKDTQYQTPFDTLVESEGCAYPCQLGFSPYSQYISKYPVGTLFFACNQVGQNVYTEHLLVCLPWSLGKLRANLMFYNTIAETKGWIQKKMILFGVVQGCDVMSKNLKNWTCESQPEPSYGGIIQIGTVRVHSSVAAMEKDGLFWTYGDMNLSSSDDFDALLDNIQGVYEENPLEYYTQIGYENSLK